MTTAIEWTDTTWNPTTGCDRVSPGCDHCYALTMAKRLKGMGSEKYQRDGDPRTSGPGFGITEHPDVSTEPLRWRKPRRVFVNSMSDLFHQGVSDGFVAHVWAVMAATPQHTYQVLTKRHGRMSSLLKSERFGDLVYEAWRRLRVEEGRPPGWGLSLPSQLPLSNVWLGVSVEDQKRADLRVPALLDTPAAVRFLSCEPLVGPVDLGFCAGVSAVQPDWIGGPGGGTGAPHPLVDWVIVGGESGPGARPMHPDWVRAIRDECEADTSREVGPEPHQRAAFFFKQWGAWTTDRLPCRPNVLLGRDGVGQPHAHRNRDGNVEMWQAKGKHDTGRELDGRTWDEYPAVAS